MYPAKVIASKFIQKGIEDSNPVTQMKLQKLVYFAHGLYLAEGHGAIISEEFEAWKYGPVAPSLYQHFKLYGSEPIADETMLKLFNDYERLMQQPIQASAVQMITTVWGILKNTDAVSLSAWTHEKGSPWELHYKVGRNERIPNEEIGAYFKQFITDESVAG